MTHLLTDIYSERPVICFTVIHKMASEGQYLLHHAVIIRNVEEIDRLVASGVDINERDAAGIPPLHYAIHLGYIDIMNHLVAKGIMINSPHEK